MRVKSHEITSNWTVFLSTAVRANEKQTRKLCISGPWASYQIRKIAGCACAGNAGNVFLATAG